MLDLKLSCIPERMNDQNKLLFLILQELKIISGTAPAEESKAREAQIRAYQDKINAMSRADMMSEIKLLPDEEKPEGWTKLKTDDMRMILLAKGGDSLVSAR